MTAENGTLHGVGLGPGDPDLITRRAARLIASTPVIAYPAREDGTSLARSIAADLIAPGTREIPIPLPMRGDREPAQAVYDRAAAEIAGVLQTGQDVVALCEGDPLFYGSFMYLQARLSPDFPVQITPGVTAFSACAARAALPLVARNAVLSVLPAPLPDADLTRHFQGADTVVLMKVGRHLGRVRVLLGTLGLADRAVYVERATQLGEQVLPLAEAPDPAPYFSMILVTKGADPWL
ncbi:MAG: precorrin-2 C(20)-methyltransferase [Qingshengfaniella sp.]